MALTGQPIKDTYQSLITSASASGSTITFIKGDGSTFPITVDTESLSNGTQYTIPVWTGASTLGTSSLYDDGSVLKSVYGGNDAGLITDFIGDRIGLGVGSDFSNVEYKGITITNSGLDPLNKFPAIIIGDSDTINPGNLTNISIVDFFSIINTSYSGSDIGLKLDFANNQYWIGDEGGVNNGSAIIVSDINSQIRLLAGAVNNVTSLILEDNPGYIYTQYQSNDTGLRLDFSSSKYELGQLTGGNQTKLIVNDASQSITLSGSLYVSGSGRFTNGLTVTGSLQAQGIFSVDKDTNGSGSVMIPVNETQLALGYPGFPTNPKTGSMFYSVNEDRIYIYSGIEWKIINLITPA